MGFGGDVVIHTSYIVAGACHSKSHRDSIQYVYSAFSIVRHSYNFRGSHLHYLFIITFDLAAYLTSIFNILMKKEDESLKGISGKAEVEILTLDGC